MTVVINEQFLLGAMRNKTWLATRDGKKVLVIADRREPGIYDKEAPFIVLYENGDYGRRTAIGLSSPSTSVFHHGDIVGVWQEPHPLEGVPQDHPIYVWNPRESFWEERHFAYVADDVCYVYGLGESSWSTRATKRNMALCGVHGVIKYRLPTAQDLINTSWEGSPWVREDE